jgi:4-azaleucine resistance transporter AzlC
MTTKSGYVAGARAALPVCVAIVLIATSFGVLARASGFGRAAPIVFSLTTYGGSAQFAAVSIFGAGGSVISAVVAALLLNARYGVIATSVAPELRGRAVTRFFKSQLVTDESWVVANRGDGTVDGRVLVGAGVALCLSWQLGTVIGVLGGDFLTDPRTLGLDAAFPALFLALLAPQVRSRRALAAALIGATIALVLVPIAEAGVPIIVASLGCLAGWRSKPDAPEAEAELRGIESLP